MHIYETHQSKDAANYQKHQGLSQDFEKVTYDAGLFLSYKTYQKSGFRYVTFENVEIFTTFVYF